MSSSHLKIHFNLFLFFFFVLDGEANLSTETSNSTNGDVAPPSNSQQLSATPNDMRPTNPTPGHASGNGTPTPLRPTNPTPLQASTADNPRPSNPTPKQASEILSQESPIQEGPPHWTTNLESVQEVAVPPSAEEDVAGPIEAEDPEEDGNIPVFSGEFESTFASTCLLCGQIFYSARVA